MKSEQNIELTKTRYNQIAQTIVCMVIGLIAVVQTGCSSTGAFPAQQVFRPPTPAMGYSANYAYPNQGWGQQGGFQGAFGQSQFNAPNPGAQFGAQINAPNAQPGYQFNPGNASPAQWGAGNPNLQSHWQALRSNLSNPFGFANTTC